MSATKLPRPILFAVTWLLALSQLTAFGQRPATTITGKVVGVTDGDTLTLLDDSKHQVIVRLEGIDAPESAQPFGTQAKKALSEHVFGKSVTIHQTGTDKYGRTLGKVYVGNRYINRELVTEGLAWHYKEYNRDPDLAAAENEAKAANRGLWRDDVPNPPWDFRHTPKTTAKPEQTTKTAPAVADRLAKKTIVFTTDTGDKYHRDGCVSLRKSKHETTLANAKSVGYEPCKLCHPPK